MLSTARRKGFVGRWAEQELFRRAIDPSDDKTAPFKVLYIHGPGGIGKSALLRIFAEIAKDAQSGVVRIDGREVQTNRWTMVRNMASAQRTSGRSVLLIDTYEMMIALDAWIREDLIPELPADVVVVLACRYPPASGWRDDPGWRELCEVLPLRPLSNSDAEMYLAQAPMSAADRREVLALAAGNPLVLTLACDLTLRGTRSVPERLTAPDVVAKLIAGLVDAVPGPAHRRALQVCAWARATTEALLRDVLGVGDAAELFDWLCNQPYVEAGSHGLYPHDAVRAALVADLAWRDPAAAEALNLAVRRNAVARARSAIREESDRGLRDLLFCWRHDPTVRPYYDWASFGSVVGEPARPVDRDEIHGIVARFSGATNADLIRYWFDRQLGAFVVYRRGGVVQSFLCKLVLHEIAEEELQRDPLCAAAWRWSRRQGVDRHEPVVLDRCMLDRDAGELVSPGVVLAAEAAARHLMTRPNLTHDFVVCIDPNFWAPFYSRIGFRRIAELTTTLGGQELATFVHDWRVPDVPDVWRDVPVVRHVPTSSSEPDPAFVVAVRDALKGIFRPDHLARSALLDTSLAATGPELRQVLAEAIGSLRSDPRDQKLFRALDRTYLHPAPTQEIAAELLGLPFSTYRRHLAQGVQRLVAVLWAVSSQ